MSARYRIGVVGCGTQMTTNLMPALQIHGASPVAACDCDDSALAEFVARFGSRSTYKRLGDMLVGEDLDGVCIAVGRTAHTDLVIECIERGIPVFVEKPLATSLSSSLRIQSVSHDAGVPVIVGFHNRFAPLYRTILQIGKANGQGRPVGLALRASCASYPSTRIAWLEYGMHFIDLVRYLVGDVNVVYASRYQDESGGFMDCSALRCTRGRIVDLSLSFMDSWENPGEALYAQWSGESATVENARVIDYRSKGDDHAGDPVSVVPMSSRPRWSPNSSFPSLANSSTRLDGYLDEIGHFLQVIGLGVPSSPTVDDFVACHQVVAGIEWSISSGLPSHLDDPNELASDI